MRTRKLLALGILMLIPFAMEAQTHVKRAFEKFIKNKDVEIVARHSLDKDPETGKKKTQADIYSFTIAKANKSLLRDIENAFDDDQEQAYTVESGTAGKESAYDHVRLAGGANGSSVTLGSEKGSHYTYACFIDPDDPEKIHRYAYGMDWKEKGNEITGQLVVTYATTAKYRSGKSTGVATAFSFSSGDLSGLGMMDGAANSTLGTFHIYAKKLREKPESSSASIYANQIYNLCKQNGKGLADVEKNLISTEIHKLAQLTKDEFLVSMLNAAIEALKE